MKRLKWFIIPTVILLFISIIQKPQSQIVELGAVSYSIKAAINDSLSWIHTWAGTDSVKINFLRIFAEDDSVKINFLRIFAEADSEKVNDLRKAAENDTSNYNDTWISWLAKYASWDEAHTRVGNDSSFWTAGGNFAKNDSTGLNDLHIWANLDSALVNFLRIFAEDDSVKTNFLRIFAEEDSVKTNDLRKAAEKDTSAYNTAALHAAIAPDSVITGVIGYKRRTYLNIDADRTLSVAESGSFFVVTNIAAKRRYTLPPAAIGLEFTFWVEDNDSLIIDGYTTNGIKNLTNAYERFAATDGVLKIIAANATTWFVVTEIGTWTPY